MATFPRIAPCLWFEGRAEEAARFYVDVFERSRLIRISRYGNVGTEIHGGQPGAVMTVEFELLGLPFTALNGGPQFKFNEAVSLQIYCSTQQEIDALWGKLSAGGDEKAQQCGWLKDRFGLSWQIVPEILPVMMADQDPVRAGRVTRAMLDMKKLDIVDLERAYAA
jgi:predicted 3-demethylubiquinone-9 3-methyltransferase (glyoxalase superfamily)